MRTHGFENVGFVLKKTKKTQKTKRPFMKKKLSFLKMFVDLLTTVNDDPSLKIVNDLYKTKFLV